jgi:hypothetical protein
LHAHESYTECLAEPAPKRVVALTEERKYEEPLCKSVSISRWTCPLRGFAGTEPRSRSGGVVLLGGMEL